MYFSFSINKIYYKAHCTSTSTVAMQLIYKKKNPEGIVVISDYQTQGRGQRGNTWLSEPYKNLTFSYILAPYFLKAEESFTLNMITALAIYQALSTLVPKGLSIKWPNDIYYQHDKLSGILIENLVAKNKIKYAVVGIGINVNQDSFQLPSVTSLSAICGKKINLTQLFKQMLINIQDQYNHFLNEDRQMIQHKYLHHLYGLNHPRSFISKGNLFQGCIEGIDPIGRLIVKNLIDNTIEHYHCQEISFVK